MREIPSPLLSERTTLHVGGIALAELTLENSDDALVLQERVRALGGQILVLGAGSNILACDGVLPFVLVRPLFMEGPEIIEEIGEKVFVRAGAGMPLARLLRFCATQGLSGLEGLVGIPGSVGGAVAMNAGSHGTETGEHVHSLDVLVGSNIVHKSLENIHFTYRDMRMPDTPRDAIVVGATFSLTRASRNDINTRMRHNFFKKKSKQPVTAWSAGCVFKNPSQGVSAGKLLDMAGFKGKQLGGMAFSALHANFLINEGKGSATEALALLHEAQEVVLRQFGVHLEHEVRIVPCPFP